MRNINKKTGFSAVELLITLFIAAAFLVSGYQLYAMIIKDSGESNLQARANNVANEYLQRYKSYATDACTPQNPITNQSATIAGLSGVTITVAITCPYNMTTGSATGGTVTYSGGNTIHTFTSSGTLAVTGTISNAAILAVGGGGGGGVGGGGGGGVVIGTDTLSNNSYAVTVGNGGTGSTAGGGNGGNSSIDTITAYGGGGGGGWATNGSSGGSGGGGGHDGVPTAGGSATRGVGGTLYGNAGGGNAGFGAAYYPSGGGGGAGGAGANAVNALSSGNGGAGVSSSISGVSKTYGAGGGGGLAADGGTGPGFGTNGVSGDGAMGTTVDGSAGTANTGGGGGGGANGFNGKNGGSGIVIISYPTPVSSSPLSKVSVTVNYNSIKGGSQSINSTTYVKPTCPTGFVPVPGSTTYNTSDFCVMKYEAKNNGSGKAVSVATGTPWVSITQIDASKAAASACKGCHLITEAEWMTIAQNVLGVASNWSGGTVGTNYIFSGHNDNSPANALEASSNDSDGYINTGNTTGSNQRRTLTLTNGEVVWDMAGNVWEWTSSKIDGSKQPGLSGESAYAWKEWNNSSLLQNGLPSSSLPASTGLTNITWNSSYGVGRLHSNYGEATQHLFLRGGFWLNSIDAGILALDLDQNSSGSWNTIGFRITR